jgi:two-component system LytT family response regulator
VDKYSAVIIEDEEASQVALLNYLNKYCEQINVVGQAKNIIEGYELIQKHQPQIVFLDVEMPFGNAFDLLEKFENIPFETIFITAYSQYAIEAINLSASSYLLKPVGIDALVEAVERAQKRIEEKEELKFSHVLIDNLRISNRQHKKIVLPKLDGFEVVVIEDIVRCQANDNLCDIYLTDGSKRTVCRTLKHFDTILSEFEFIRTHKSHLVNGNKIKEYKKGKGGYVLLSDGSQIEVSNTRKESVVDFFTK